MREILFRGKSQYTGKWGESVCPLGLMHSGHLCNDFIPETVGQFTGLKDKNGVKIFEGNIVRATDSQGADLVGMVVWIYDAWCVSGANWADTLHMANHLHKLVVIGNIHDNPELLKGGLEDA